MSDTSNTMGEQVLGALGLDTVCVQVYLSMHSAPEADSEQLAERLGFQLSEVVDAIDELSDLTLLRPGVSPTRKLRPVSIERAIQTLIRQQSEQLKIQTGVLTMLQSAMKELLAARPARPDESGHVDIETVTGAEAVQAVIDQLLFRAAESVWSAIPGARPTPEMLESARPIDEELAQRGLPARSLYQNSVLGDRPNMEYARWLNGLGIEIRSAPVVPVRMLIVDRALATVIYRQPQLPLEMFIIREPALLIPLIEFYEMSWEAASPIDRTDPKPTVDDIPTPQEGALLRLLAGGSTDEAAAKKLGVSVRTIRRMMADLMERLGATSRFEAGHRATQRGWL